MKTYYLYTDGGVTGNGTNHSKTYGSFALFDEDNNLVHQDLLISFGDGGTNNTAEYQALIEGLKYIINNHNFDKTDKLITYSDSQLIIYQIQDKYKIKLPHLGIYKNKVNELKQRILCNIEHIWVRRNVIVDVLGH
jgi:ribonuclease HI